jgi:hypothetical protein
MSYLPPSLSSGQVQNGRWLYSEQDGDRLREGAQVESHSVLKLNHSISPRVFIWLVILKGRLSPRAGIQQEEDLRAY